MTDFDIEQLLARQAASLGQQQAHDAAMADQQDPLTGIGRVQTLDRRQDAVGKRLHRLAFGGREGCLLYTSDAADE